MSRPLKKSEMNHFLPGGIGIEKPHPHDILSGRGGASNNHMGNKIYRTVCEHNKGLYAAAPRNEKLPVAKRIFDAVRSRNPPGRFLERKKEDKLWYEVTDKRAIDKTAQALREKVHKAIMLPLDEVPYEFAHLVGEETEAAALAAFKEKAAAEKAQRATATKKRPAGGKAGKKSGDGSGSGSNKKVKLDDERFALPSKLRNISFGGFFHSTGGASTAAAAGRSDTSGSYPSMPPLSGDDVEPASLESGATQTDPNLLVQTALAPSTSLFNFFGLLGGGTSGGIFGGNDGNTGNATTDDDRKPAAAAAAAPAPPPSAAAAGGSPKRRKKKCLTAATADARTVVETQATVRETSLTRDISSFLPSFLERGITGLVTSATSLGAGISGVFSGTSGGSVPSPGRNNAGAAAAAAAGGGGGNGCISQITQGVAAAAPAAGAIDDLVPPPPFGGLNRGTTLTGDDDFDEDPAMARLRMIPPSLNGSQNGSGSMSMPIDDRKRSSNSLL